MNRYLRDKQGKWYEGYQSLSSGEFPDDGKEWADKVAVILGVPAGSLEVIDDEGDPRTGVTAKEQVQPEPERPKSLVERVADLEAAVAELKKP